MRIGEAHAFVPAAFGTEIGGKSAKTIPRRVTGRVEYINRIHRYLTVRVDTGRGALRESFKFQTRERMINVKTIAIVNLKDGVGKTITAINVAAILATGYGQRVLLIDADLQVNAIQSLFPPGEYNILAGLLTIPGVYYDDLLYHNSIRDLDVLPVGDELRNLDTDLLQGERPNLRAIRDLWNVVAGNDAYDHIVIDCPSALSPACAAATVASANVVIPIRVGAYSVRDMNELTAQIDRLRSTYPDMHVAGCLPAMWYRSGTMEQGERLLQEQAPVYVFASHIRRSPKVDEPTWAGEPVVSWSLRSTVTQDYRASVAEFLEEGAIKQRPNLISRPPFRPPRVPPEICLSWTYRGRPPGTLIWTG